MSRATAPVVGVAILIALTVMTAAAVGTTTLALETPMSTSSTAASQPTIALSADAEHDALVLAHDGGPSISVQSVRLRVAVEGQPLAHQPPTPFFAAAGFKSGPTGPLNPAGGTNWSAGERARLALANTNAPLIDVGDEVTVRLLRDDHTVVTARAVAG